MTSDNCTHRYWLSFALLVGTIIILMVAVNVTCSKKMAVHVPTSPDPYREFHIKIDLVDYIPVTGVTLNQDKFLAFGMIF